MGQVAKWGRLFGQNYNWQKHDYLTAQKFRL